MKTVLGAFIALTLCFHCNVSPSSTSKGISASALKLLLNTEKHFDLIDLLKFSISNPQNRDTVEIVFGEWFLLEKFEINAPNVSSNGIFADTLSVLQHFGHLITKLKVDYRLLDTTQCEELNKCLNDYCSESLVDIELVHCDDDKIIDLRRSFKNVENVKLHLGNLRSNASKFDEIFPELRRLDLSEMYYTHAGCFEHNFPHLEHLTVEFWCGLYPYTVPLLEKRLQSNPQLKNVTIYRCTWHTLEFISKHLLNLESLIIREFHDSSIFFGNIHFESVKVFKFKADSEFRQNIGQIPIVFGNLEEIEFHNSPSEWIEIMQENKGLKIVTTGSLDDLQFMYLFSAVPNLQELCTGYNEISPVDNIIRFMSKATNLKKLRLTALDFRVTSKIMERKDREWRVEDGAFVKGLK